MDSNLVILTLEYTYLASSQSGLFESNTGLWQGHSEWSKTLIPYNLVDQHAPDRIRIIDNMSTLRHTVMALNHHGLGDSCHIKLLEPQLTSQLITISINGNENYVNNSRTEILKAYHHVSHKRIPLAPGEFKAVGSNFLERLRGIATRVGVEIVITDHETDFKGHSRPSGEKHICILGNSNNLSCAETDVRILMDTLLGQCAVARTLVPLSVVPCLGGANMGNFLEITRESHVNIYLPHMMPSVFCSDLHANNDNMPIWVTSKSLSELALTSHTLNELLATVDPKKTASARFYTQKIDFPKDKLDLVSLYRQEAVLEIMLRHGTYVQLPSLGDARDNTMVVQGQTLEAVQETACELCALGEAFYRLEMAFSRGPMSGDLEYFLINLVSLKKSCILTYNEDGLEIVGSKAEVHELLDAFGTDLKRNSFFHGVMQESESELRVGLTLEVANDERDFLSGKKNGKVIKILSKMNHLPTIRFSHLNSHNFNVHIDVKFGQVTQSKPISLAFDMLVQTIRLVETELPAQIHFNVPEVFHKSIIGNGGAIIQSIMKKYNVFIKFSSEFHHNRSPRKGGQDSRRVLYSFRRNDNVLVKCPMKNSKNIGFVKYEIDNLVQQCCVNQSPGGVSMVYNTVTFKLLKSHYSMLIRKMKYNVKFVTDLEARFSSFIDFPKSIDDFQGNTDLELTIKGNDANARMCADELRTLLPQSYVISLPFCGGRFEELVSDANADFREQMVIPFRLLLEVELVANSAVAPVPGAAHQVVLSSYDDANLHKAVECITQYLRANNLMILEKSMLDFDPILSFSEIPSARSSPTKHSQNSPTKNSHNSPTKNYSPTKNHSPTKNGSLSPTKGQRSPARNRSPTRNKPLGVITNHTSKGMTLKSVPLLENSSARSIPE